MGKNKEHEQMEALQAFIDRGLIADVLGVVKSGKEATVYCCEAGDEDGARLLAAKVYRSRDVRSFRDDAMYTAGRIREPQRREARAVLQKSRAGRKMAFGRWVADEYATLSLLHDAGVAVPRPYAQSDSVIIMEFLGDAETPAPPLSATRLDACEAQRVFDVLMLNVELMLACDRVHGDLSAYNVLYHDSTVRIIDFPQAVDARFNTNAQTLLERDIEHLYGYFERMGVRADPYRIARDLWRRFLRSEL